MPFSVEQRGVAAVVGVAGVAAVDDQVTLGEQLGELGTVSRVGSPDGTITQTTRGASSASTSASRTSTSLTSGLRS